MILCGGGLVSCQQSQITTDTPAAVLAISSSSSSSLTLFLTDASDQPLVGQQVRWRPVFEAESAETPSADTNAEGHLVISDLLPGVRYLFSTSLASLGNASLFYQWYQVPLSPKTAAWQWVLASGEEPPVDAPPAEKPTRLHYLSGATSDFKLALALASAHMVTLPLQLNDLRPQSDVVWWVSGNVGVDRSLLASTTVDILSHFVSQGGTLVVNGEWAGMQSESAEIIQALGLRLGFRVSRDTLAQDASPLMINNIHDHWLTRGIHSLAMSRVGSVRGYNSKTVQELAFAGAEHYQIAGLREQYAVLASIRYGQGRVILIGDSSLWSDRWFQTQDNRILWQNVLSLPLEASVEAK